MGNLHDGLLHLDGSVLPLLGMGEPRLITDPYFFLFSSLLSLADLPICRSADLKGGWADQSCAGRDRRGLKQVSRWQIGMGWS